MTLFGVDVSNNNWSSVAQCQAAMPEIQREGFSWVEAKVSEGNYYSDPYWAATLNACNAIGLPCIGYHYVSTDDPTAQARLFVENGGGNVAMLDFEANSGDIGNFWAVVAAFNAAGVQITLSYIPRWYWQDIGSPDLTGAPGLVASGYVGGSGYASELYPGDDDTQLWASYGGATPAILQFTDSALVAGILVDANAFRGNLDQLTALLTGAPVTQPDPTLAVAQDNQIQLRGPGLNGWPQLDGHTVVDALALIGQKLGIPGFAPPA